MEREGGAGLVVSMRRIVCDGQDIGPLEEQLPSGIHVSKICVRAPRFAPDAAESINASVTAPPRPRQAESECFEQSLHVGERDVSGA